MKRGARGSRATMYAVFNEELRAACATISRIGQRRVETIDGICPNGAGFDSPG